MYALSRSASNLGRGEAALDRDGGGERNPDELAMNYKKLIQGMEVSLGLGATRLQVGCDLFGEHYY